MAFGRLVKNPSFIIPLQIQEVLKYSILLWGTPKPVRYLFFLLILPLEALDCLLHLQ